MFKTKQLKLIRLIINYNKKLNHSVQVVAVVGGVGCIEEGAFGFVMLLEDEEVL